MLKTTPNKVLLKKTHTHTHDTFAQSQMRVPHRRIQDANGACILMGLKPVADGRWVNSNDTSGSRGRGRCGVRRVEGGGVWKGGGGQTGQSHHRCFKQTELSTLQVSFRQCNF